MKEYVKLDGEKPCEVMTEEELDAWRKKHGVKKPTEEEIREALEEFYKNFPDERPR